MKPFQFLNNFSQNAKNLKTKTKTIITYLLKFFGTYIFCQALKKFFKNFFMAQVDIPNFKLEGK